MGLELARTMTFTAAWLLATAPAAMAQGPSAKMLVLDASGSMWGEVGGQTKIQIAREVVGTILDDWQAETQLGLTVYGHRVKGDCSDIEVLLPVAPVDAMRFRGTVDAIHPLGMTPLSDAVIQAAKELRYTTQRATVVLISDGKETCNRDPCEVGRRLEEAGLDFTAHVIGFDVVDHRTQEQLRCLAENTGGSYRTAEDAAGLRDALSHAVREATAPGVRFVAMLGEHRYSEAVEDGTGFYWIVRDPSGVEVAKYSTAAGATEATLPLTPGEYTVVADPFGQGPDLGPVAFSVAEGETGEVPFPLGGRVSFVAMVGNRSYSEAVPKGRRFYWSVRDPGGREVARHTIGTGSTRGSLLLPAGNYQLVARKWPSGPSSPPVPFTLEAGDDIEVLVPVDP